MKSKVSGIVRADACGLGTLARMFSDYLGFHRTLSISRHKGGSWPEWYGENNRVANDGITPELAAWLCDGADAVLSFELWYGEATPRVAKQLGVKTALVQCYECCVLSGNGLEQTDLVICPSSLDLVEAEKTPGFANSEKVMLPMPFDTTRIPFRQRERALTFLHNAGHGGLQGRNSTAEVLEAWRHVKSPAKLVVRMQPGMSQPPAIPNDPRIRAFEANPENYWELFDEGDVFLHPTKWDGHSLPIQESLCSGMPVITTRFWPYCDAHFGSECRMGWMPQSLQAIAIPFERIERRAICRQFNAHCVSPLAIAASVDAIYGESIEQLSLDSRACAESFSWDRYKPIYEQLFDNLTSK